METAMKKVLVGILIVLVVLGGVGWYVLSGAGDIIKAQIEKQGSSYLGVPVAVGKVELALGDGKLVISDFTVKNPKGYSDNNAFSFGSIVLDLGNISSEPYVVDQVAVNAASLLFEMDDKGKANLQVIKENLDQKLPESEAPPKTQEPGANPLVSVNDVSINETMLSLDFEKLPTGDLKLDEKAYSVTLPSFSAGAIGKPNGIPADQVGVAIARAMLDNALAQAKVEGKNRIKDKAKEKLDEKKDELLDKAKDKLKGLLGNG
jgi:hypothetical protein